jgi:hypothetical protein
MSQESGECSPGPTRWGGGKTVNVRVQRADNPSVMATRVWGAHEWISVKASMSHQGDR